MPAVQTVNPDQQTLTLTKGLPAQFTFVPTTPAGTAFNCTGYSVTPVLNLLPNQAVLSVSTANATTPTVASATTTGITITLTVTQVNAILAALFGLSGAGQLVANDSGGDTLVAWSGSFRAVVPPGA